MDTILFNHCSPSHSPAGKQYWKGGKKNHEDVDESHNKVCTKIEISFINLSLLEPDENFFKSKFQ